MTSRYKGASTPRSLILRLLGDHDYGHNAREFVPPPEIQLEAADEIRRLEREVQLHMDFLVGKKMLREFLKFAPPNPVTKLDVTQ